MYKDKNGEILVQGDEVVYYGATYVIEKFKVFMKGVQACGVHGCFDIKEVEKVIKEEPKKNLD
jgi:hypothetical protein